MEEKLVKLSFLEHYSELRRRVIFCIATFILTSIISYYYVDMIYDIILKPLYILFRSEKSIVESTNVINDSNLLGMRAIFTSVAEKFLTDLYLSSVGGFLLSLPVIIGQIYSFISSALYKRERAFVLKCIFASLILFSIGACFGYYIVIPLSCKFFFGSPEMINGVFRNYKLPIAFMPKISEYVKFTSTILFALGIFFLFPLLVVSLNRMNLVEKRFFTKFRRHFIVLIFIIAAIITPPDVMSQIAIAIPLVIMYELAILACKSDVEDNI